MLFGFHQDDRCFTLSNALKAPEGKIREMPMKKVSRVIDVQKKNNQVKSNFTVPVTDPRARFNRPTCSPAISLQQLLLGTSHLILGDSLMKVLQNFLNHHGDGLCRCQDSPAVSDGGANESIKNP